MLRGPDTQSIMASSTPSGDSAIAPVVEASPVDVLPVEEIAALKINEVEPSATEPAAEQPPHRSHNPSNNLKRSDPFQFGSRYLEKDDNVYEFNAWDHVETDDAYKEYAEQQYAKQRENPVSDFEKSKSSPLLYLFAPPRCVMIQHQMHSSSEI